MALTRLPSARPPTFGIDDAHHLAHVAAARRRPVSAIAASTIAASSSSEISPGR